MGAASIKDQIVRHLENLTPDQQQQVLDFAKWLHSRLPAGIPGEELIARAREVGFEPGDLAEMAKAIEDECERVDWDGW